MTTRSDRRRNDEQILRAAAHVLALDPGAGMQAVADAAGVARLTVYRRYPDRAALVAALRVAVDAELQDALDGLPPWTEGISTLVELVTALAGVAARYPVALLRYSPGADAPPETDRRVTALLSEGQRTGALREDIDADVLNAALFGVLSAVLGAEHARAPDQPPEGRDVAPTVLALIVPGLAATTSSVTATHPRSRP